ncbi:hypothetical protein N7481_007178 [Penicillium waksmanii]|uniref:uncharacterized protein n=1 Tax=Penicillium waksmanii TaxID=69791 RepID=UPI0025477014|nr:uncharacterized protein N7481_007178 [Penicillium waksmanii]KAJ5979880.1 hypothetical protein N7481_007178 [Penicillium waksmanii]
MSADIGFAKSDQWSLASDSTKVNNTFGSDASTIVPQSRNSGSRSRSQTLVFSRLAPLRVNMRISAKHHEQAPLYFIHVGGMLGDHTDITMHEGVDKTGRVLGSCRFNKFRSSKIHFKLGKGENSTLDLVTQHGYYQWSMPRTLETSDRKEDVGERFFLWRRSADLDRDPRNADALNLDLCSPEPYEVHATYAGALPGRGKGGVLEFKDDLGEDFKVMAVLTLSVLVEKARQKRDRSGDNTARMMAFW